MKIVIHQICYSEETLKNIPEGFLVLDNLKNERPDWREYWPIRNFLLENELEEDTFYGFFSPKFHTKTGLSFPDIENFIKKNYTNHDTISFSPFWDLGSIFINIFEQGDFFHPGLMNATEVFSNRFLDGFKIRESISHSKNNIFCNYIIGKKSFWKIWLHLGEMLFSAADLANDELSKILNDETSYGMQRLPMKIFIQERLATLCLLNNTSLKNLSYSPFYLGSSITPFSKFFHESIISDALKIAFTETKDNLYISEFIKIREDILKSI